MLLTEFKIGKWIDALHDVLEDTRRHVEQKQIRTWEEIQVERAEREETEKLAADDKEDSDEDEEVIYNPLHLPLGWDGKPIPYWLYKVSTHYIIFSRYAHLYFPIFAQLHGLGIEYKCEICGNESYWGRRAFDRHFQVSGTIVLLESLMTPAIPFVYSS